MYNRLISFLDKYNVLSLCQKGLRKGMSTEHTLIEFRDFATFYLVASIIPGSLIINIFLFIFYFSGLIYN